MKTGGEAERMWRLRASKPLQTYGNTAFGIKNQSKPKEIQHLASKTFQNLRKTKGWHQKPIKT